MGRWTNEYQDSVLTSKLKGLVSGAIKRAKLEKSDPTISYRHFVEDLDAGDSFTTSVIEILVQELAERRLRSSPDDRRLIADRTAKSLRMLATPIRVYRERRNLVSRRMADYLSAPPDEMDVDEDDDDFDAMLDRSTMPEGVRINSELYDAYGSSWTAPSMGRRPLIPTFTPTPPLSDDASTPPSVFTLPTPTRVWSRPPVPGSVSRQPSLRRPTRSRTVDFNDFTSMRRSSTRETRTESASDETSAPSSRTTRRFFPFSSSRSVRHEPDWSDNPALRWPHVVPTPPASTVAEGSSSSAASGGFADDSLVGYVTEPTPSSAIFYTFPTPPVSSGGSSQDDHATTETRARVTAPRLRRGGVRPPESLLFRRDGPPEDFPETLVLNAETDSIPGVASYPTPGSPASESGHETRA